MKTIAGIIIGLAIIAGGFYLLNNSGVEEGDSESGLTVVTSFYPLQFALENIVGDLGTVTNIGAGRDPHDFEPSVQDMVTLQRSDLVVLQGAEFEPWGDDVSDRLAADNIPVVIATANLTLHEGGHEHDDHGQEAAAETDVDHEHEDEHREDEHEDGHDEDEHSNEHEDGHDDHDEHDHGSYDPHTWLDPVLFADTVRYLASEISALDPANAATYEANAAALIEELEILDGEYQSQLTSCTFDEVITSHDAFSYLAERYEFEVHTIAGLSTQDTPSAVTLAELREEAEEGIGAILLEENSVAAYGETLARETGLMTLSVNPISYLIPENEDYFSLMRGNLNTFATALACNE